MSRDTLVIAHAHCADGMTAAWLFHRFWPGKCDFHFSQYGDPAPDVTGKTVYVVDFSYPKDVLLEMKEKANFLTVLDHHKTAKAALEGLDFCVFDMERSGAQLTLEHVFAEEISGFNGRWLIDYTADRDLWKWQLISSKEINATISSFPLSLEGWDQLAYKSLQECVIEGTAILRYQGRVVDSACRHVARKVIAGYVVPCTNATNLISEIGNKLSEGKPFAATWFQREDGKFVYSLRSNADGIDVSEIAKQYGGGGHRNAAGFMVDALL